jgi:hypothetical protein
MADLVNHPPHYKHPSGVECITIVEHMSFLRGNAIKYLWRAGQKGDALEDLRKARWYLDREIANLEAAEEVVPIGARREMTDEEWQDYQEKIKRARAGWSES